MRSKNWAIRTGDCEEIRGLCTMGYNDLNFDKDILFLVTGGAGFIGSNITAALVDMGYRVRILDNFSTGKQENLKTIPRDKYELIDGDIRSFDICLRSCKDVDFVLHQAAWGSVPKSIEYPLLYEEINIKGTLNMMEAARQEGVKRFVYASSSSVYGDSIALPKKEGQEGKVLSPYALTKKVNEEYGRMYTKLYGLETIGLRYFNVFGRNQDPNGPYAAVIPKFIKLLLKNQSPVINGDGRQSRDFTYIENVIEANLKACLAPQTAVGEVYNIAYGGRQYLIDVYKKLCELLEKDIDPVFGPERPGDIKHSNADISKARELLGYDPEYSFDNGIEETINWYRYNLTKGGI